MTDLVNVVHRGCLGEWLNVVFRLWVLYRTNPSKNFYVYWLKKCTWNWTGLLRVVSDDLEWPL